MSETSFNQSIKNCIRILGEDLFLSSEQIEVALKIGETIDFSGKPTVIACSILYYLYPQTYDLIMFTSNITSESLIKTTDKIASLKN